MKPKSFAYDAENKREETACGDQAPSSSPSAGARTVESDQTCIGNSSAQPESGSAPVRSGKETNADLYKYICDSIRREKSEAVSLALLFEDAADECCPGPFGWYCADFRVSVPDMILYADAVTYPNQFGAYRSDYYPLTPEEFHRIAMQYGFPEMLKKMETAEDWKSLVDDQMMQILEKARAEERARKEEEARRRRLQEAAIIPDACADREPRMEFDLVRVELMQMYGDSKIALKKEDDAYRINCHKFSHYMPMAGRGFYRTLKKTEAVWTEEKLEAVLKDPWETTWRSLPGGDKMTVEIVRQGETQVSYDGQPLQKYMDLLMLLENLAQYESFSETEARELNITRA